MLFLQILLQIPILDADFLVLLYCKVPLIHQLAQLLLHVIVLVGRQLLQCCNLLVLVTQKAGNWGGGGAQRATHQTSVSTGDT